MKKDSVFMQHDLRNCTLFEVSWEVCNKVGGIYTVVSSKALEAVAHFGDNYFLLGPDLGDNAEFEPTDEPCWTALAPALQQRNLNCRFGRWNIPGRPKVILVGFRDHYNQGQLLYSLWNRFGVDSISGGWDYAEPVMFSTACGEVIETAAKILHTDEGGRVLAHFHEWMCGGGLLHLKQHAPAIGTIFTTHATMLGRALSGAGVDIYAQRKQINPRREADAHNITAKHSMESTTAREADCFTTVSRITADEAASFLGRTPDVVTTNGIDLHRIPDFSEDRSQPRRARAQLLEAAGRLLRRNLPADTHIFMIGGRYEFHNKGIDIFLDALGQVNEALAESSTHVLALCAVMGGHSGPNPDAVSGDPARMPGDGSQWITSHYVYNPPQDPILNACRRLNLDNRPENHVQVIFDPALLNGQDGFLNMPYQDVLSACDLGVFPSWYEPWGYTPQESIACAVPTVTSDLAGFGLWVRDRKEAVSGVEIISREQTSHEKSVAALRDVLLSYAGLSGEEMNRRRAAARALCRHCTWEDFYPYYGQAYDMALTKAAERAPEHEQDRNALTRVLAPSMSTTPSLHCFTVAPRLPESISRLRELAYNLWWCWHPECHTLFSELNPAEWQNGHHNPVTAIDKAPRARLRALAADPAYIRLYNTTMEAFDAYMNTPQPDYSPLSKERPLAYFSTEYGLTECLPIYSGGLGVLSGDHLKSASDLLVPLVGVGLLYKSGYFRQAIDKNGRQVAMYPQNDFSQLPLERVFDDSGEPMEIMIQLSGRRLFANIWRVRVGRVSLYLMDTDTPKNTDDDRRITARLYEADRDVRLRQEILLGCGGVRMLRELGINPAAYHMNEGHSAFLVFERLRELMLNRGLSFAEAGEVVRGSTIFTTHTPVDAGNERFNVDAMESYFKPLTQSIGISWNDLVQMGRYAKSERNVFEMTVLALNYAYRSNGVSALHGYVSRQMWQEGWPGVPAAEIPIGHVTNGIHVPSYAGPAFRSLLNRTLGEGWEEHILDTDNWKKLADVPDDELWTVKQLQKKRLLDYLRAQMPQVAKTLGIPYERQKAMSARLTPASLVIGFARRFAPYKRANLLFADIKRLCRILDDDKRPVIFVFAGKAHPADTQGIDIMQEVLHRAMTPELEGKIFFIPDYDLAVSRLLSQGCDVWLNTPRRPREASGTSGQKVPVNGGLNLSVSDGWWCEGFNGRNGWNIGAQAGPDNSPEQNDYDDAESLYSLLEEKVVPLYFERDAFDLPHGWLGMMRDAMTSLISQYSSHRMLTDYIRDYYQPAARRHEALTEKNFALARKLATWKADVVQRFGSLKMENLVISGLGSEDCADAESMHVSVDVLPGDMTVKELLVQLVVGPGNGTSFIGKPDVVELILEDGDDLAGRLTYTGDYTPTRNGRHIYGIRVMPVTAGLDAPIDTRLVLWA